MLIKTLLIDLDDTVYSSSVGIWDAIGVRMERYLVEVVRIPAQKAPEERRRLFHTYGTTMRGLIAEYQIDDLEFLEYVHDIPIEQYLSRNDRLRATLEKYPQRKVVFTNAHTAHAERVLRTLGIDDLFESLIDIRSIRPWCKPQTEAFSLAFELASIENPAECLMADDAYRNLVTAHEFGLFTVQVGTDVLNAPVNAAIKTLEELPSILPY